MNGPRAFSLIELLVVISVIIIMASFTAPSIASVLRGNEMNRAEQLLVQQLASARQTAIARNRRVEVRFYSLINPDAPGASKAFCAMQTFLIDENNRATALGRVSKLPVTVLMNEAAANSSLLSVADKQWDATTDPQISLPGVGTAYTTKTFQFRPDGSTSLSSANKWYVTMHSAREGATAATPPPNFATIQVDPVSGAVRSYRP
jgi:uncharacterized protein (TIGR02596 family)